MINFKHIGRAVLVATSILFTCASASAATLKVAPLEYYEGIYSTDLSLADAIEASIKGWASDGHVPFGPVFVVDRTHDGRPRIWGINYKHANCENCTERSGLDLIHLNFDCPKSLPFCEKTAEDPCPCIFEGNPIYSTTGLKRQTETDYSGANGMALIRTYRSDRNGWADNYQNAVIDFNAPPPTTGQPGDLMREVPCYRDIGQMSGVPYCFKYVGVGETNDVTVMRGNDRTLYFGTATDLRPETDINDRLVKLTDAGGLTTGWTVYNSSNDATERYDQFGRLQTTTARNGQVHTFTYSDASTPIAIAPRIGLLLRVADQFGHQISFTYDAVGRRATMRDPAGGLYQYAYDEDSAIVLPGSSPTGILTSVTYPDGKRRQYWYNEQDKTSNTNQPFALTGITDENGARFATWTYDKNGRATSSEHGAGIDKYTFSYMLAQYQDTVTQSTVIDPLGANRTYNFEKILGVVKGKTKSQPAGAGSSAQSSSTTYDGNGNVATSVDFNGIKTVSVYDLGRNLETSRTEAYGTAQARTISTGWHPTYRVPLKIAEPKRVTTFTYDAAGNQLTKTIQATNDTNGAQGLDAAVVGSARKWTSTYNGVGQVLTITGPRTDVLDKTTYTYDAGSGNISTISNAAGHLTTLSNYDANGRVGRVVAPTGAVTDLTYTPRGWLASQSVTAAGVTHTTTYDYDGVGQLKTVTLPDRSAISYTYDDAHRLIDVTDTLGNAIHYVLDAKGNQVSEKTTDPAGTLTRQVAREYDVLSRLQKQTGAAQ